MSVLLLAVGGSQMPAQPQPGGTAVNSQQGSAGAHSDPDHLPEPGSGETGFGFSAFIDALSRELTLYIGQAIGVLHTDTVSREISAQVGPAGEPELVDAVSRELSVFIGNDEMPPITDTVSRELSVHIGPVQETAPSDATSREYSVFIGLDAATGPTDAVGRELSVFIGPVAPSVDDAISRELSVYITAPDLEAVELDAPANGATGELIDLSWRVINVGERDATGPWTDRAYLSSDTNFDVGDIEVATYEFEDNLPAGGGAEYLATVEAIVSDVAPGPYWLLVVVDADGQVEENDRESNNVRASNQPMQVSVDSRPDLRITAFTPPADLTPGEVVQVTWTIENAGTSPAAGPWNDTLSGTDGTTTVELHAFTSEGTLAPGDPPLVRVESFTVPDVSIPPGEYQAILCLDSLDVVRELDEENNCTSAAVCVDCLHPDLVVTSVVEPAFLYPGGTAVVRWTVQNIGTADAPSTWIDRVYLSEDAVPDPSDLIAETESGPLAVGAVQEQSLQLDIPLDSVGERFVIVVTDAQDAVFEFGGEDNNQAVGEQTVPVVQTELPDLEVIQVLGPNEGFTGQAVSLAWIAVNNGTGAAAPGWVDAVYLSSDDVFDPAPVGDDQLVSSHLRESSLLPGAQYAAATDEFALPDEPGTYWLFVKADAGDAIVEANEANNVLSHVVQVADPAYAAAVQAGVVEAVAGTPVILSGQALSLDLLSPVPNVPVTIYVDVQGFRRTFTVGADANGDFSYQFHPAAGEAGLYGVAAGHPNAAAPALYDDTFTLLGLKPASAQAVHQVYLGDVLNSSVPLINFGDVDISGITVQVDPNDVPDYLALQVDASPIVPALGTGELSYALDAVAVPPAGEGPAVIPVHVDAVVDGTLQAIAAFTLVVQAGPDAPALVINGGDALLEATMVRGSQTVVQFELANIGGSPATNIQFKLPCAANDAASCPIGQGCFNCQSNPDCYVGPQGCPDGYWLNLATPSYVPALNAGESTVVELLLQPIETVPLGPHTGLIVVESGEAFVNLSYTFNAVSDQTGELLVLAEDELTYWGMEGPLDGAGPRVAGASVSLTNAFTGSVIGSGVTDPNGEFLLTSIPEGFYTVEVRAENHGTHRSTVEVVAGGTGGGLRGGSESATVVHAFMPSQYVTYIWDVVPTDVEDEYIITIDSVFETFVPIPVVTVEPESIDLGQIPVGQSRVYYFIVTNHGFIAAEQAEMIVSSGGTFTAEASELFTNIGDLGPGESVVVPVTLTRDAALRGSGNDCGVSITFGVRWSLVCRERVWYFVPIYLGLGYPCPGGGGAWIGGCPSCTAGPGSPYSVPPVIVTEPPTCEPPPNRTDVEPPGCPAASPEQACVECPDAGDEPECGQNANVKACTNEADPVYLFSGEFFHKATDLRVPGRGLDFIWARKYRSKIGPNTAQGNGWDFAYNVFIEPDGTDLILHNGDTRADRFKPQPNGTWGRDEFFYEISRNADDSYTLLFPSRGKWNFHPFGIGLLSGKLISIADRHGNTLVMHYDESGRLIGVTDTIDRDFTIAYNADGFIESVTDYTGRQVTYAYYQNGDTAGSFGDLKSVTTPAVTGTPHGNDFPDGKKTSYTYSVGFPPELNELNHNLLTITDGRRNDPNGSTFGAGPFVLNTYAGVTDPDDANFDRLVRQEWGGDMVDLVYQPLVPSAANGNAVMRTIVNDRNGNVSEYFSDIRNRLIRKREFTGRADPTQPTGPTSNRPANPLRGDDPQYFETRYTWNADSMLNRLVLPNGNVREFVFEADVNPNSNRRSRGNLRESVQSPGDHDPAGDQTQIVETFEYDSDFGGCCGFNFVTRHVDGRGHETLHDYDDFGNRIHTTHRIPSIVEDFEYNEFGQLTAHVRPDNGSGHRRRDEFTFHQSGPQRGYLHQAIVDAGGFALTSTFEYDTLGRVIRRIDPRGHDTLYEYNVLDQVVREVSREVADGSGNRYERLTWFDANNNVIRVDIENVDETGAVQGNSHLTTLYEYEILNEMTRTCREVGSADLPPSVTDCSGVSAEEFVITEYEHDGNRNRTLVRNGEASNGNQPANLVRYVYDERDLLFAEIRAEGDADQSTTLYAYDGNRNLARRAEGIEDSPHVHRSLYDGYDRLLIDIDPMGNVTTYAYDENGNLVAERVDGQLVDVLGGYDCALNEQLTDLPIQLCDLPPATNVRLSEVTHVFDEVDRRTREERAFFDAQTQAPVLDGLAVTQTFYSGNSQVVRTIDDNGNETLTAYDTANRPLIVTDAKGNTVTYAYNANSRVTAVTETDKSDLGSADQVFITTFDYDNLSRLTSVTDSAGNVNRSFYDSRDNRSRTIDANGNVVRNAFDGLDRLTATIRELTETGQGGGPVVGTITTQQVWDDSSRLVGQIDDNGNRTTYVYDALDRKTGEIYADGTQQVYILDVHGNRIVTTDANGNAVTSTFDRLDRLITKNIQPGPGVSHDTTAESFAYDGLSRLVAASDDDSVVTRGYDSLSRVTRETLNGQTTTSLYDGVGNLLSCTYPGGRAVSTAFDPLNRQKLIGDQDGSIAEYFYVGPSRVERREYGNGTRTEFSYDGITGVSNPPNDFGVKRIVGTRHTRIADGAVIDDRTYTWDPMYNKTRRKDVRAGGPRLTHDYAYDSIYRLIHTHVTDAGDAVVRDTRYLLDGVGNRNEVLGAPDSGDHVGPYTLDPTLPEPADFQMNQYTTVPTGGHAYDANGNLIGLGVGLGDVDGDGWIAMGDFAVFAACIGGPAVETTTPICHRCDLDGNGRIDLADFALFSRLFGGATGGASATIRYDYANRMVEYFDLAAGRRHTYAYDALGRRIAKVVDADTAPDETRFFYFGQQQWQVCEEQDNTGTTQATYVYGRYIDEVLNMRRGGGDYFYYADDLYNVMAVSDSVGSAVERYDYADYGEPRFIDISGVPISQSAIRNSYTFTGRHFDAETGQFHYRTRYMDPLFGRFAVRDTFGLWFDSANHGNPLAYVGNSPWSRFDPDGRIAVVAIIIWVEVVAIVTVISLDLADERNSRRKINNCDLLAPVRQLFKVFPSPRGEILTTGGAV